MVYISLAYLTNQGEEAVILSQERRSRSRWISAICRADLTDEILYDGRVCGRHFVSGQAAKAWDRYNVDWVATFTFIHTLNLGHDKKIDKTNLKQASQRGHRQARKRENSKNNKSESDEVN